MADDLTTPIPDGTKFTTREVSGGTHDGSHAQAVVIMSGEAVSDPKIANVSTQGGLMVLHQGPDTIANPGIATQSGDATVSYDGGGSPDQLRSVEVHVVAGSTVEVNGVALPATFVGVLRFASYHPRECLSPVEVTTTTGGGDEVVVTWVTTFAGP